MAKPKVNIFWHRRDLRLDDNHALFEALNQPEPVQPVFIFDTDILDHLNDPHDARVSFIHHYLQKIDGRLREAGSSICVYHGKPVDVWKEKILTEFNVNKVYANRDYAPYAIDRDKQIFELLKSQGIPFIGKKDHVIFDKAEVMKKDGTPYAVYTPYSRMWKARLKDNPIRQYPSEQLSNWHLASHKMPTLEAIGFKPAKIDFPDPMPDTGIIEKYHKTRNIPSIKGTTRLSVHLRFGTISIRTLAKVALDKNEKYLNELIWRDFYQMILYHFPKVADHNFNAKYDALEWRNNEDDFKRWCTGHTGYPIVDAGMRELNKTGYMHNRVRMITASFLTKHLLIDWRWGEAYFAEKLLDYELASNNGGWQWAAGTGVDAAPYFRIFNPESQVKKFDPELKYVRQWVPEFQEIDYTRPMVDHKVARERALSTYKEALTKS